MKFCGIRVLNLHTERQRKNTELFFFLCKESIFTALLVVAKLIASVEDIAVITLVIYQMLVLFSSPQI